MSSNYCGASLWKHSLQFVAFQLLAQALLCHSENRAWRVLGIYSPPPNQVTIAVGGLGKGVGLG